MKIALINDQHFGVKGDAVYMLDFQEKFYHEAFFPYLKANAIKTVLIGGDLFDRRKYINFSSLKRSREMFFDVLLKEGIDVQIIPGNHDVVHKNSNEVNSIELLLAEYTNITYLAEPTTLTYGKSKIDMIPWINGENYESTMRFISKSKSEFCYAHLELAGFEMYAGVKNDHGMSPDLFKKYKSVWSGHFHHKSTNGNINYLGAPMEFTFADAEDARGFHVFDSDTQELEYVRNTLNMFEKIYYNDEDLEDQNFYRNVDTERYARKVIKLYVVRKTKPALFEYFVEKIYDEDGVNLVIHEDYSEFHSENIDIEVKDQKTTDLIGAYVDTAETDMDKDRLKNILMTTYVQALNVADAGSH